jgi:hypothetical protein
MSKGFGRPEDEKERNFRAAPSKKSGGRLRRSAKTRAWGMRPRCAEGGPMNAIEFLKKYELPDSPHFDTDEKTPGIQPRVGDEDSFIADFRSLPPQDKYAVTRRFFFNPTTDEKAFFFRVSPLKNLFQSVSKRLDNDGECVDEVGECLPFAHKAFDPLDRALQNPKADPWKVQRLVFLTRKLQQDLAVSHRLRLENGLVTNHWENSQYDSLMDAWEERYQTSIKLAEKQGVKCPADRSPFFDYDEDGISDCRDPDPIDARTMSDRDGDGVDDLLDAAPLDPKVFFRMADLAKPSLRNGYDVERAMITTDDGAVVDSDVILISSVIGLVPAAEDGVSKERLEELCEEFAERVTPHLDNLVPESLREKVRFSFAFTTDVSKAHRLVCVSRKSREHDGEGQSMDLVTHDIPGLKLLHELGHLAFGLEDHYHNRTDASHWEEDRTLSPHHRWMQHPKDLMIDKDYIDSQIREVDIKRLLALATRRGAKYRQAGAFRLSGGEMNFVRSRYRFDEREGKLWLAGQAKILKEVDAQASKLRDDPFIQRQFYDLQGRWVDAFVQFQKKTRAEIIKISFVNIARALRQARMARENLVEHFGGGQEKDLFLIPPAYVRSWQKNLELLIRELKEARGHLRAKKPTEALGAFRGRLASDDAMRKELLKLRREFLLQDVRIRDVSFTWVPQKGALPKIRVVFVLASEPPREEGIFIEPMRRHEAGEEFQKRALKALKRELDADMRGGRLWPENALHARRRNLSLGVGGIATPSSPVGAGGVVRADYRIHSGKLFFGPRLGGRYQALIKEGQRAQHTFGVLPGFFFGRDLGTNWFVDVGLAAHIQANDWKVRPYAEAEIGRHFDLGGRKVFGALGVEGNVDRREMPSFTLRFGSLF